jgi:hypothetical protein
VPVSEIIEIVVLGATSILALKMAFDAAGGFRILRSPKVLLPFGAALTCILAAFLCAYGVDRVRAGTLTGVSAGPLLQGMVGGLLLGMGGFGITFLPNMRRRRQIEEYQQKLQAVVGSSSPLILLGAPSELIAIRKQLLEYHRVLSALPSPDQDDRSLLMRVQERIDQINHSLRAGRDVIELPGSDSPHH